MENKKKKKKKKKKRRRRRLRRKEDEEEDDDEQEEEETPTNHANQLFTHEDRSESKMRISRTATIYNHRVTRRPNETNERTIRRLIT